MSDDSLLVPVLAMLSSGVAACALAPRNRASRVLLVGGVCAAASVLLEPAALSATTPSVRASLLRYAVEATFLVFSAGVMVLTTFFPDGVFERAWHRRTALVVVGLATVGPLLGLVGAPSLDVNGEAGTGIRNVLALPGLEVPGRLGAAVAELDPFWLVLGFVILLLRFRAAGRERRTELGPLLGGLVLLALFLVPVIVETLGGPSPPQPAFEIAFRVALGVLPVALLVGISRSTRLLARDLAASRGRIISAEDEARRRIERDLHDGVQQHLVALLSLTELAARQARHGSAGLETTLADVRRQLTDAIEELRELVYGIRPPVLEDSGVAAALESRLRRLPGEVSLDLAGARGRRWPARTEAAAYFVACEAVTNALKHAPGSAVRVRLHDTEGDLRLEVEDDGPGLPTPTAGTAGRVDGGGLVGLRDRVDSLGGVFSIGPGSGGGTLVRAVFADPAVEEPR